MAFVSLKVVFLRSIFILLSIGATCYLLWALFNPTQVKSSHQREPHEKLLEPVYVPISSDLRALLPSSGAEPTTQCGHIIHRKSRPSDVKLGPLIGMRQQVVIESRKALYCHIGRIGSSRWKRLALKTNEGLDPCSHIPKDKFEKMYLANMDPEKRRQIIMDDCYFRFTFLRDPFSRLLSAWHAVSIPKLSPDFGEFVRREAFVGDSAKWNLHWRPLVKCCGLDGTFDYDFIGRWEDKQIWMPLLIKRLGMEKEASSGWGPPTDHFLNTTCGSLVSQSSQNWDAFYTVELLDRVAEAYQADLQAFNYTTYYHYLRSRLTNNIKPQHKNNKDTS